LPYSTLIKLKKFTPLQKKQLLDEHRIFHAWWHSLKNGKILRDKKTHKLITRDTVRKRHRLIVSKIFNVGFCHHMIDSLDQTLPKTLIKLSKKCSKE